MSSRILPSTPTEQLSCYQAFPHSLAQRRHAISFLFNNFRTLLALTALFLSRLILRLNFLPSPNPQVLSLHRLAASLPLFQELRSFFSITCSLFSQNTRVGVG